MEKWTNTSNLNKNHGEAWFPGSPLEGSMTSKAGRPPFPPVRADRSNSGSTIEPEALHIPSRSKWMDSTEALWKSEWKDPWNLKWNVVNKTDSDVLFGMIWTLCWSESEEPEVADQKPTDWWSSMLWKGLGNECDVAVLKLRVAMLARPNLEAPLEMNRRWFRQHVCFDSCGHLVRPLERHWMSSDDSCFVKV